MYEVKSVRKDHLIDRVKPETERKKYMKTMERACLRCEKPFYTQNAYKRLCKDCTEKVDNTWSINL